MERGEEEKREGGKRGGENITSVAPLVPTTAKIRKYPANSKHTEYMYNTP